MAEILLQVNSRFQKVLVLVRILICRYRQLLLRWSSWMPVALRGHRKLIIAVLEQRLVVDFGCQIQDRGLSGLRYLGDAEVVELARALLQKALLWLCSACVCARALDLLRYVVLGGAAAESLSICYCFWLTEWSCLMLDLVIFQLSIYFVWILAVWRVIYCSLNFH